MAWRAERALVPPATRRAVAVVPSENITEGQLTLTASTEIIYPAEPRAVSEGGEAPGDRWMRDSR